MLRWQSVPQSPLGLPHREDGGLGHWRTHLSLLSRVSVTSCFARNAALSVLIMGPYNFTEYAGIFVNYKEQQLTNKKVVGWRLGDINPIKENCIERCFGRNVFSRFIK